MMDARHSERRYGKMTETDLISRQDAIDALDKRFDDVPMELTVEILQLRRDLRERIPSAQPDISDDGTLMMTVPNGMLDVKRVMVDEISTKNCEVMCQDALIPEQECEKCIFKPFKQFQPERKKGNWIKISPANIYECSECGKNVMTDDISAYDFCHGCGAEMER